MTDMDVRRPIREAKSCAQLVDLRVGVKDLKISIVRNVKPPTKAHCSDAGIDFFVPEKEESLVKAINERFSSEEMRSKVEDGGIFLCPHEDVLIPSGVKANVPDGFCLMAAEKSGVATKQRLQCGAKVVDSGYQGEIHIHVFNHSNRTAFIKWGQKIIQFLMVPVPPITIFVVPEDELFDDVSSRGAGGFGSSGI